MLREEGEGKGEREEEIERDEEKEEERNVSLPPSGCQNVEAMGPRELKFLQESQSGGRERPVPASEGLALQGGISQFGYCRLVSSWPFLKISSVKL